MDPFSRPNHWDWPCLQVELLQDLAHRHRPPRCPSRLVYRWTTYNSVPDVAPCIQRTILSLFTSLSCSGLALIFGISLQSAAQTVYTSHAPTWTLFFSYDKRSHRSQPVCVVPPGGVISHCCLTSSHSYPYFQSWTPGLPPAKSSA